jgi:hypothetical protein
MTLMLNKARGAAELPNAPGWPARPVDYGDFL